MYKSGMRFDASTCGPTDLLMLAEKEGISFGFYDPSAQFIPGKEGYQKYLELEPDGSYADEAHYKIDLRDLEICKHSEAKDAIQTCQAFLKKYPNSRWSSDVHTLLNNFEGILSAPESQYCDSAE